VVTPTLGDYNSSTYSYRIVELKNRRGTARRKIIRKAAVRCLYVQRTKSKVRIEYNTIIKAPLIVSFKPGWNPITRVASKTETSINVRIFILGVRVFFWSSLWSFKCRFLCNPLFICFLRLFIGTCPSKGLYPFPSFFYLTVLSRDCGDLKRIWFFKMRNRQNGHRTVARQADDLYDCRTIVNRHVAAIDIGPRKPHDARAKTLRSSHDKHKTLWHENFKKSWVYHTTVSRLSYDVQNL
jgi:hypothetical protein